jgi:hypothetical protein
MGPGKALLPWTSVLDYYEAPGSFQWLYWNMERREAEILEISRFAEASCLL